MTAKDPCPYFHIPGSKKEEGLSEKEKNAYGKITDFSFRWTSLIFLSAFFLASQTAANGQSNTFPGQILTDLAAAALFFLPVLFAAVLIRICAAKKFLPEYSAGKFLFLLPSGSFSRKQKILLFCGMVPAGFLLQIPVLLTTFLQKELFHLLKLPLPPQERVRTILNFLENGNDLLVFLPLLLLPPLLLSPLAEEFFFRLVLFEKLRGIWQEKTAIWVSTILFSLLHGNTTSFLPLLIVGYACQKVYLKSGSILASVLLHFAFNLSSFLFLLLAKYS